MEVLTYFEENNLRFPLIWVSCFALLCYFLTSDSSWRPSWTSLLGSAEKSHCLQMSLPWAEQERNNLHLNRESWVCGWKSCQSHYDSLGAIKSSYWSSLGLFNLKTKRSGVKRNGISTEWHDHRPGLCVTCELKLRLSVKLKGISSPWE